jgi:hypothetical protein
MKNLLLLAACVLTLAAAATAQPKRSKIDIGKKIADATPAALPQIPKDRRPRSDAQDSNLKGKVKSIATYIIDYENGKTARALSSEEFYGEDGNLVRAVDYHDDGYPRGVSAYGYIDGARVSRWRPVVYFDGEGYASTGTELVTLYNNPPSASPKDKRYDVRFLYKYDRDGRLSEETHFSNAGEVLTRTVHEYEKPDRRLIREFADGKQELARLTEILDPAGNVIEIWYHDEDKKPSEIRANTYEFDPQGNWIVKKTFEKQPVEGKPAPKPLSISYRTISYYP